MLTFAILIATPIDANLERSAAQGFPAIARATNPGAIFQGQLKIRQIKINLRQIKPEILLHDGEQNRRIKLICVYIFFLF